MNIVTKQLSINNNPIKVHGISTGLVSVKTKFREANKKGLLAALSFMLDRKFTEWMPIWTWVIEHPEGIFVIDTGENSRVSDKGYFKPSGLFANWLNTTQFKFDVENEDELDSQLLKIGIPISRIKKVILTHLHLDHIDGLKFFPDIPILVNKLEWEKPYGDLPKLYPNWFEPELISLQEPFENFKNTWSLTKTEDLIMVETPGHTHGHASILLKADQGFFLFAGDVVYHQSQILENKFAGANVDFRKAEETYSSILEFANNNKLVFLPSHDIDAGKRLQTLDELKITNHQQKL
jgi:glyoxylase-like metal-dependent hydrolase (beta-lactamase superfamily II)